MKNKVSEGITIEFIREQFFDSDALTPPSVQWRRMDFRGRRYYWDPEDIGGGVYPGITGVISAALPKSYQLQKWEREMAVKAGDITAGRTYMRRRGIMGTVLHILIGNFFEGFPVDLALVKDVYRKEMESEGIGEFEIAMRLDEDIEEIKRAFISVCAWVIDYGVEPLACELILKSSRGYVSPVDLICRLDVELEGYWGEVYKTSNKAKNIVKGETPKLSKKVFKVPAVVDYKISKAVYDEYDYQLTGYVELVGEHFPKLKEFEIKDESGAVRWSGIAAFCWHPPAKRWSTDPNYSFTMRKMKEDWPLRCEIGVKALNLDVSQKRDQILGGKPLTFSNVSKMERLEFTTEVIKDLTVREALVESLKDEKKNEKRK